jgi:transketolase
VDGHRYRELILALDEADREKGRPKVIIAQTVKGKGVSFLENNNEYHGKPISLEQLKEALKEL